MTSYPIDNILPQLKDAVLKNPSVILQAPPGAGKTTRVPLVLLDALSSPRSRIIMLEPRRIAAVSAARWMAQSLNEQVGETVGYTIRFDTKISRNTRIEVVTEGILTRRIQSDPGLDGVDIVIFDEFHERSIHADLALALCLDVRKHLRQDLKVLIMSATMDYAPISSLLANAKVITSSGKAFPVEERYLPDRPGPLPSKMAAAVRAALRKTHGDVLAFLPGAGEIRSCARELQESLNLKEERLSLHPLYGNLPFEEQERAILPSKDHRKIVLATNIAETSLTIEGVHVVIDSGLSRRLRYDASSGMNRLVTVSVSKASAEQRKGRAGRLGPGVCYRLYPKHELNAFPPFTRPEILESDLSSLALEICAWGVKDPSALSWLDTPPVAAWNSGLQLLRDLGALDTAGSITSYGREMVRLPLHPRLSRLMIRARELDSVRLGAELAAIISERDFFRRGAGDGNIKQPDITERLDMLHKWQRGKELKGSLDESIVRAVDRTAKQLLRLMPAEKENRVDDAFDHDMISRLLLAAFPDRICKRREDGKAQFVLVQGRGVRLSPDSHLVNSPFIIAVNVDAGEKAEGFVHIAADVGEKIIRSECSADIRSIRRVEWDGKEGRITAALEERIGGLLLSKKPFTASEEEAARILCDVIREDPGILRFSNQARQLQARAALTGRLFPEENWPDLSDEELLSKPQEWLLPWLRGIRSAEGLRALDVLAALKTRLSREQQRLIDERAPAAITVPSGSRIRLDYSGGQPILAVKLQEMFGLANTPAIAEGRAKLLIHLLSPAGRPVQVTQDLKGFWKTGYPLVKKDLKGRYPKHPWPDDPGKAMPTKRTKPRGE